MCDTIYEASGVSIDWAYGVAGVKYSYTMELRQSEFGFEVPPADIEPNGMDVLAFHLSVAQDIVEEVKARK